LLYPKDYVSVATRLSEVSDVLNLLDFILHLLRDRRLTSPDATTDFNQDSTGKTVDVQNHICEPCDTTILDGD